MKGTRLEMYPSSMMSWKQWRMLHPASRVLTKRTTKGLEGMRDRYGRYHQSAQLGVTGTTRYKRDGIGPKARVVAFRYGSKVFAVPLDDLRSHEPVNSTAAGSPGRCRSHTGLEQRQDLPVGQPYFQAGRDTIGPADSCRL